MSVYLADANFLLRLVDKAHLHHPVARAALSTIRGRGDEIVLVAQSLFKFYVVATRPSAAWDGFGFTSTEASRHMRVFQLLPEAPLLSEWERLIATYGTIGLPSHDARYIAAIAGQKVDHILTFNAS